MTNLIDADLHHELPGYVATWSPCKKYRYTLWRVWGDHTRSVQFIGLNPSTATETEDDPTVRRCVNFARAWGYGAMCMTNLFAFRATDPQVMKAQSDPTGERNDEWLRVIATHCMATICAWGNHGAHLERAADVGEMLADQGLSMKLHCMRMNAATGQPAHPLYLPASLVPLPWRLELFL